MKSASRVRNGAEMMRRHIASITAVMLFTGAVAFFNTLADRALMPLGELVASSDLIIIGTVTAVEENKHRGAHNATIRIDQSLRGTPPYNLELSGNYLDPGLPQFYPKTSIIAFLTKKDSEFVPVAGDHGVLQLSPDSKQLVQRIVKQVVKRGKNLQLANVQYALKTTSAVLPVVFEGSLLEELSHRATKQDARLIEDMACASRGNYRKSAQHWAIHRIGILKLVESRPCLERLTRQTEPRDVRILAVEALGDLGDTGALKTLLPMVPETSPTQKRRVKPSGSDDDSLLRKSTPGDTDGDSKADRLEDPEQVPVNASDLVESRVTKQASSEDTRVPVLKAPVTGGMPFDHDLTDAVLLALGKIGSEQAINRLQNVALYSNDPSLSSTAVHALGLIGTPKAYDSLSAINKTSRDALLRDQVSRTMKRLRP